jgi:predicted transcriptional regulator
MVSVFVDAIVFFCNKMHITLMITLICLIFFTPVLNILILFFAIRTQNRERENIFYHLMSVPKNYISELINKVNIGKSQLS